MSFTTSWVAEALLPWFDTHGRHELPWQAEPTPYRVWVSEVMLQQTQVETVKPYFERFTARFPDAVALAAAAPDEVMALWAGLGYYARARNLHRAAREITARHGGELPGSLDALMALPGIGRSTAGAILALARGVRQPILDGTVKRVLARAFLVVEAPDTSAGLRRLWELAEDCTPDHRVADYTQAVMDLGATVCTRSQPSCPRCPLAGGCAALAAGRAAELPAPKRRAPRRERSAHFVFVLQDGRVLLERRPPRGIWGSLWTPPEFPDEAAARAYLASRHQAAEPTRVLPPLRHVFTHFDLVIQPWVFEAGATTGVVDEHEGRWHELGALNGVGVPAPVAKLIEELKDGADGPLREARPRGGRPRETPVSG